MSVSPPSSLLPDQVYGQEDIPKQPSRTFRKKPTDKPLSSDDDDDSGSGGGGRYDDDRYGREMRRLLKSLEDWNNNSSSRVSKRSRHNQREVSAAVRKKFLAKHNIRSDFFCHGDQLSRNQLSRDQLSQHNSKNQLSVSERPGLQTLLLLDETISQRPIDNSREKNRIPKEGRKNSFA